MKKVLISGFTAALLGLGINAFAEEPTVTSDEVKAPVTLTEIQMDGIVAGNCAQLSCFIRTYQVCPPQGPACGQYVGGNAGGEPGGNNGFTSRPTGCRSEGGCNAEFGGIPN